MFQTYFVWFWCKLGLVLTKLFHSLHNDVIKWKHFPHYWPFIEECTSHWWIPLTKVSDESFLIFSLMCTWINNWVNSSEAGDLRHYCAHHEVIVMSLIVTQVECNVKFRTKWQRWSIIILWKRYFLSQANFIVFGV